MAATQKTSIGTTTAGTFADRELAHDAYEDFWASVEHPRREDVQQVNPAEQQPEPGAAYEEFLQR